MRELDAILGVGVVCTLIGWIFYVVSNWWLQNRRLSQTTELHRRLLDRMGDAESFGRFLESEAGQRMVDSLSQEAPRPFLGAGGVLRAFQAGVVVIMLSLAMFALGQYYPFAEEYIPAGIIFMAIGLGLILAGLMAYGLRDKLESR